MGRSYGSRRPAAYPVIDISTWDVVDAEVIGRNPKVWVREPGGGPDRRHDWLFKPVVIPLSTGHRQGEDWAEKIVAELGRLLGIPCARVELAVRNGQAGCTVTFIVTLLEINRRRLGRDR